MMPVHSIYHSFDTGKTLFYAWFEAMHTRMDIVLCNQPEERCGILIESVREEVLRLEKMMNRFDESGELYGVNKKAWHEEVVISEELFAILESCVSYYRKTQACFDMTIHSLNNYRQGIAGVLFCKERSGIRFLHPDIQLDLGGFAKGYALDQCIRVLQKEGVVDALVNFGNSSVFALGNHPNGKGWKVSKPSDNSEVTLFNECLSTSGNKANQRHIIAPETGEYIAQEKMVSVVTGTAEWGEILSTALFVAQFSGITIPDNLAYENQPITYNLKLIT